MNYPLHWPDGWKRTPYHRRKKSRYSVKMSQARDSLLHELKLLGARDVVISTNITLRRDGLPYANGPEPMDPGVAVYWSKNKEQQVIACDCWSTVTSNMRAVGLTVAALRQIERTGASQILERAFLGFKALPPAASNGSMNHDQALTLLGLSPGASEEEIQRRYKQLAQEMHPDHGGSQEQMTKLNQAKDTLRS